ncbi:MAG: PadR family transcriptional regulator [Promethearchaeota archaeon]
MWLGKFLDLKNDIESMKSEIKKEILADLKKKKLTPLGFTILENILNNKELSGYDIIQNLNKNFAGTWKARSGTIYPILSKLKNNGFLKTKQVKSEVGPLKKVYYLTKSGESVLKVKVKKNFKDQINFIENFLIELAYAYIQSSSEEDKEKKIEECINEVLEILKNSFSRVINGISSKFAFKTTCPKCNSKIVRKDAVYCALCGASLHLKK